ncbi:MAG: DUF2092 domain-containing protein [Stellaceae bacterium]
MMRKSLFRYLGALAAGMLLAATAAAQNRPAAPNALPPATPVAAPVVAEQADRLLKEMGAYIGSAEQFTFHADVTFDHVLPSGQKLQFSAAKEVALKRPGGLHVEWSGDLGDRQFWYDGKSVTLYDPATPFYSSEAAPPEIDSMLAQLVPKLDFAPPLADFLYKDPYKTVRGNLEYGFDLGQNDVNGRTCRTLAFVEKDIDWQIWIENGPQLTPCKLVITYKNQPAQPLVSAVFSDWDFAPRIAEPIFTPELPPGTEKIPFATVTAAK